MTDKTDPTHENGCKGTFPTTDKIRGTRSLRLSEPARNMIGRFKFALVIVVAITFGCKTAPNNQPSFSEAVGVGGVSDYLHQSLRPQNANINVESEHQFDTAPLENFNFSDESRFMRLSLDQCIENALQDSEVIRELGGTVLRSPELIRTEDDPAMVYTDPRSGEEAALSEFDAVFSNQLLYQNNDRAFNSSFIGDQGSLTQDTATNITNLTKRSATGGLFQVNHQVVYDRNNTPANRFLNNTSYDTFLAAEFRQPLLQGSGVLFNRIAGPNNLPGVNNGVLIARTNTDISLADFELGIRNLVSDVENAYWDLYFAYRDLEAKIEARNGAYEIWKTLEALSDEKKTAEIRQAEEQYYLFASRVENAIHGQLNDGTRTNNGSSSGTFRGNSGVRTAERRLRLVTGLAVNGDLLLVPGDMPIEADVVFDWEQVKNDALNNRAEIRRQRWVLKREQLNYLANKNQLLPRLDLIGRYRVRGFGNDLFGSDGFDASVAPGVDPQNGSDAFGTFLNGDLQEWELGMDLNIPIGYRRQIAAVRNSELAYTREKKILHEQEREIIYGLSNALGELQRASSLIDVNSRRLEASKSQYMAIQEDYKGDDTTIDLVLESQRRVIEAKLDFFKTQVELMLAIKAIHFEKGTVLTYHNVSLSEKGWGNQAMCQANNREANKSDVINYSCPGLKTSLPISEQRIGYISNESVLLTDDDSKTKDGADKTQIAKKILGTSNTPSEILGKTGDVWSSIADQAPPENESTLMSLAKQMEAVEAKQAVKLSDETLSNKSVSPKKSLQAKAPVAKTLATNVPATTKPGAVKPAAVKQSKIASSAAIGSGVSPSQRPKASPAPSKQVASEIARIAEKMKVQIKQAGNTTSEIAKAATKPVKNLATPLPTPAKTVANPVAKNPNVVYQATKTSPAALRMKSQVRSLYDPSLNRLSRGRVTTNGLPPATLPRVVKAQTSSSPMTTSGSLRTTNDSIAPPQAPAQTVAEKKPAVESKPSSNPGVRVSSLPGQGKSSRRR